MTEYVTDSIVDARFNLLVLPGFATASLLLAGMGLHRTLAGVGNDLLPVLPELA